MNSQHKARQSIALLSLSIVLAQDAVKGTWVGATGAVAGATEIPIGVTEYDGSAGENITVTTSGTVSMNMDGIATANVNSGDAICFDGTTMVVKSATDAKTDMASIKGIVLGDANVKGHAEVLLM